MNGHAPSPDAAPRRGETLRLLALAATLAALAGWVDATAYIHFHGLFVSFMSGNSTQGAVAAATGDAPRFFEFARTIVLFVVGVTVAESVAASGGRWSRPAVLALECATLAVADAAAWRGHGALPVSIALALAMGMQNATMHRAGDINVSLTYVTGTLVQVGRQLAGAFRGERPWSGSLPFLALWAGLASGGFGGALVADRSLLWALGGAVAFCAALLVLTMVVAATRGRERAR